MTIKTDELDILNSRLKAYGFDSMGEMVRAFVQGKFPPTLELSKANVVDKVDREKLLSYYLVNRKYSEKYARDLVSYFKRYKSIFFSDNVEQILTLAPHKRGWVLEAMRGFGAYALKEYGSEDFHDEIDKVIKRYGLNRNLDRKQKIFVVDNDFVTKKVTQIRAIPGRLGLLANACLLSGLRQDEVSYMGAKAVCDNNFMCKCDKLHIVSKGDFRIIFLNWFRGKKRAYFCILPVDIWQGFKSAGFSEVDFKETHKTVKAVADVKLMDLRKLNYNVLLKTMAPMEADIIAGRAKSVSAQHYALYELDALADKYAQAWDKFTSAA